MDFVSDSLANGRCIKCLTVAYDSSHGCVELTVDFGMGGEYVVRLLEQAACFRGYPEAARGYYLKPGNMAYEPIRPEGQLETYGVVTGSFRRF